MADATHGATDAAHGAVEAHGETAHSATMEWLLAILSLGLAVVALVLGMHEGETPEEAGINLAVKFNKISQL